MTKNTKKKLLIGFIALIVISQIFGEKPKESIKEENKPVTIEFSTLGDYKESSKEIKLTLIKEVFRINKWTEKNERDYLTLYYDCMGDFAYQKDPTLSFGEVFEWCDKERTNNPRGFYAHINELDIRNNGSYRIGFDENIALLKKKNLDEATKISIALEESKLSNHKQKPSKYKTPAEALQKFGGMYDIGELSSNEILLYTKYYPSYENYMIIEEAKRTFIDAIYLSFIHTDINFISVGIMPTNINNDQETKFSFKASIKREDALNVAKRLLHINKFDDLLRQQTQNIFFKDSPSDIYNRARYNHMGEPTLDVFFEELSKVTY